MTKIIEWRQKMLSELPINEDIFVEKFLMEGIQELCRKTQCFTEVITDVSVINVPNHTLTPVTAYSKLHKFLYGSYSGVTKDGKTRGEMNALNRQWEAAEGTPPFTVYDGGSTVRWSKIPDVAGDAVEFTVSLIPTDIENSDIPEPIDDDHLETIKDYVKWKFYMQPVVFNADLAILHKKEYFRGQGKLKISVITGYIGNSQAHQEPFMKG